MRADTLVGSDNPDGVNLWMGYSWPLVQTYPGGTGAGTTVGVVESHLAQSSTINGVNGGASVDCLVFGRRVFGLHADLSLCRARRPSD